MVTNAPARFWWKGKVEDMDYFNIQTFTISKNKSQIVKTVEEVSIEEVPMVWFTKFEGNKKFTDWIDVTLS